MIHNAGETLAHIHIAQKPDDAIEQQILYHREQAKLHGAGNLVIERLDRCVERREPEAVPHHRERRSDAIDRCSGLVSDSYHHRWAAAVDHGIGQLGCDDLPAQTMTFQHFGKVAQNRVWEIAGKLAGEIWIIRYIGTKKVFVQRELRISQQHRKLRPRERLGTAPAFRDFHVGRQKLDGAIKQLPLLECLYQTLLETEVFKAAAFDEGQCEGLLVVVAQNQSGDLIGHAGQKDVAIAPRKTPIAKRNAQSNLEIDLDVGSVDAC